LIVFLSHSDKIGLTSQLTFITFKILKKISVRLNEKMLPRRNCSKPSMSLIHTSIPDTVFSCLLLIIEIINFAKCEENQYSLRIDSNQINPDRIAGEGQRL
jgi:hypothetical protein